MAAKMLVRYRTKKLKSPEEIQDFSFASESDVPLIGSAVRHPRIHGS